MFSKNQTVYIIANNHRVLSATVLGYQSGLYTLRLESGKGIRLKEHRIYPTKEAAENHISDTPDLNPEQPNYRPPELH